MLRTFNIAGLLKREFLNENLSFDKPVFLFFLEGEMERLLAIEEASKLLGLKVKTLYSYVCKRTIPFIKIRSSVKFRESDLETWIDSQKVEPIKK